MSEQTNMTEQQSGDKSGCCGSRRHGCGDGTHRRGHCLAKVVGLLAVFGIGFLSGKVMACEPDFGHGHGGPAAFMSGAPMDKEHMDKFADKRLQHMLDEVKASDKQKAQAGEIVKASLEKGAPLAEKLRDNHLQMRKLMSAATLDKAAIEALRADQIKLADEASRQMTATMLAVAEVLTPEQRAQLAQKMEQHRAGGHHG